MWSEKTFHVVSFVIYTVMYTVIFSILFNWWFWMIVDYLQNHEYSYFESNTMFILIYAPQKNNKAKLNMWRVFSDHITYFKWTKKLTSEQFLMTSFHSKLLCKFCFANMFLYKQLCASAYMFMYSNYFSQCVNPFMAWDPGSLIWEPKISN